MRPPSWAPPSCPAPSSWEFRQWRLREVDDIDQNFPTGTLRDDGHMDSIGDDATNQTLSAQRADAVKQWLVAQGGIPAGRITTKGYGETVPVAPNTNPDGSDNPDGRAKNRRVVITATH